MKYLTFLIGFTYIIFASKLAVAAPMQNLHEVGHAKLKILFWDIYLSTFYSENGLYQKGVYPQALRIKYLRDIDSKELIEQTQQEWQNFELPITQTNNWLRLLKGIYPDIRDGDTLLVYIDKTKRSTFYYNEDVIGEIIDPDFGDQFLRIWLDEECSYPKVCRQLRGDGYSPDLKRFK